jgi:dihydrofolate reductase
VHRGHRPTQVAVVGDLVDELTLIVVPAILGEGARLFPENGPDLALELIESRVDSTGVTIQSFRPAGRPQYWPSKSADR